MKWLVHWILAAVSLIATAYFVPGFYVSNIFAALFAAAVLAVLNILVWPVLALLTLPITIVTLGLFLFVVNALVLKLGAAVVPGFSIEGLWPAILGGIVLMIIGWLINLVFPDRGR